MKFKGYVPWFGRREQQSHGAEPWGRVQAGGCARAAPCCPRWWRALRLQLQNKKAHERGGGRGHTQLMGTAPSQLPMASQGTDGYSHNQPGLLIGAHSSLGP